MALSKEFFIRGSILASLCLVSLGCSDKGQDKLYNNYKAHTVANSTEKDKSEEAEHKKVFRSLEQIFNSAKEDNPEAYLNARSSNFFNHDDRFIKVDWAMWRYGRPEITSINSLNEDPGALAHFPGATRLFNLDISYTILEHPLGSSPAKRCEREADFVFPKEGDNYVLSGIVDKKSKCTLLEDRTPLNVPDIKINRKN